MDQKITIVKGEVTLIAIDEETIEKLRLWRNKESVACGFLNQEVITPAQQQMWYKAYKQKEKDQMFLIYWGGEAVGALALYDIDFESKKAEFGRMMIGEDWARGKGIAKQAIEIICQYGFVDLGLTIIYLEVFKSNSSAYKLYEKVGFREQYTYEKDGHILSVMMRYKQ